MRKRSPPRKTRETLRGRNATRKGRMIDTAEEKLMIGKAKRIEVIKIQTEVMKEIEVTEGREEAEMGTGLIGGPAVVAVVAIAAEELDRDQSDRIHSVLHDHHNDIIVVIQVQRFVQLFPFIDSSQRDFTKLFLASYSTLSS